MAMNAAPLQGTPWEWSGTPEADQKASGPTPLEAACLSPCRGNGRRGTEQEFSSSLEHLESGANNVSFLI
jgi:hypothetical protein